ncbi:MAG: hypothetical protein LIP02_08755 [Bacteroidales bacterium]|nr:hypothetical protein [Bacteroidales bacterium]
MTQAELTIKTPDNKVRMTAVPEKGSVRRFTLMEKDEVELRFHAAEPSILRLGDWVEIDNLRYELCDPYKAEADTATGGYIYEVTMRAQYRKFANKLMKFLPDVGTAETSFSYCQTLAEHAALIIKAMNALGTVKTPTGRVRNPETATFLFNEGIEKDVDGEITTDGTFWDARVYEEDIDDDYKDKAVTMTFDGTNIIDAISQIAEGYETEWWFDRNTLCFGKCYLRDEDTVDLHMFQEAVRMERSDSQERMATRLYVYGSDKNLASTYRKNLTFTAGGNTGGVAEIPGSWRFNGISSLYTNVGYQTVSGDKTSYNVFGDPNRPLKAEWFNMGAGMVKTLYPVPDEDSTLVVGAFVGWANNSTYSYTAADILAGPVYANFARQDVSADDTSSSSSSGTLSDDLDGTLQKNRKVTIDGATYTIKSVGSSSSGTWQIYMGALQASVITNSVWLGLRARLSVRVYYDWAETTTLKDDLGKDLLDDDGNTQTEKIVHTGELAGRSDGEWVEWGESSGNKHLYAPDITVEIASGVTDIYVQPMVTIEQVLAASGHSDDFKVEVAMEGLARAALAPRYTISGIQINILDLHTGLVKETLEGVFNPYGDLQSGYFGVEWDPRDYVGCFFELPQLNRAKTPGAYFTSKYLVYVDDGTGTGTKTLELQDITTDGVVNRRLLLPEYGEINGQLVEIPGYIDVGDFDFEDEAVEQIVTFEDVYPSHKSTVLDVVTRTYKDERVEQDGSTTYIPWTAYLIKDDQFNDDNLFDTSYLIGTSGLQITFQSGSLNGMTFDVEWKSYDYDVLQSNGTYKTETHWLFEIQRDTTTNLPADNVGPKVGDTFYLTGFNIAMLSDENTDYISDAENKLLEKALKYAEKLNTDPSTYEVTLGCDYALDRITADMAGSEYLALRLGERVNIYHEGYFDTYRESRVIGWEIPLDIPSDNPKYTVGEKPSYSRIGEISDKVDSLNLKAGALSSSIVAVSSAAAGYGVSIIQVDDSETPTDYNVFSALRSYVEFARKKIAQSISGLWTFLRGALFGSYVQGKSGAAITADGAGEFATVTGRTKVESALVEGTTVNATESLTAAKADISGEAKMGVAITDRVTSRVFDAAQLGGSGYGAYIDDYGKAQMVTDYLTVREGMSVTKLVIEEINSVDGGIVVSRAHGEVKDPAPYGFAKENGNVVGVSVTLKGKVNKFQQGDIVHWSNWDMSAGDEQYTTDQVLADGETYQVPALRSGWMVVSNADNGTDSEGSPIIYLHCLGDYLTKAEVAALPQADDVLVQMGHMAWQGVAADATRQGFVFISPDTSGDLGVSVYAGVNSNVLTGKLKARMGYLGGITDATLGALSGYGLYGQDAYLTGKFVVKSSTGDSEELQDVLETIFTTEGGLYSKVESYATGHGRNLLLGTDNGTSGWLGGSDNITFAVSDLSAKGMTGQCNATMGIDVLGEHLGTATWCYLAYKLRPELIKAGQTYSLSFWVTCNKDITIEGCLCRNSGAPYLTGATASDTIPANTLQRVELTLTATASGEEDGGQLVMLYIRDGINVWGELMLFGLKLEEGECATAWSAAPEDYPDKGDASLTSLIEQLPGKITLETSAIGEELKTAGIEITASPDAQITLYADQVRVLTNGSANPTALFNSDGSFVASFIKSSKLLAYDTDGDLRTAINRNDDGAIEIFYTPDQSGNENAIALEIGPETLTIDSGDIMTLMRYYAEDGTLLWYLSPAGLNQQNLYQWVELTIASVAVFTIEIVETTPVTTKTTWSRDTVTGTRVYRFLSSATASDGNGSTYASHNNEIHTRQLTTSATLADGTYYDAAPVEHAQTLSGGTYEYGAPYHTRGYYVVSGGKITSEGTVYFYSSDGSEFNPNITHVS